MSAAVDPARVMLQLDTAARQIDATSKELGQAIKSRADAENEYRRLLEIALIEIKDEHADEGKRLPAEDLRTAMAHQRIDRTAYATYLTAEAKVNALTAFLRGLSAATSARQSLLSALRLEGTLA
jgi:hypothetical protein